MSTELALDLAAMVGEMEAPECEHSCHMKDEYHSDEPATHYVQSHCPGCVGFNRVYPACPEWVKFIRSDFGFICTACDHRGYISDFATILGPVNK